MVRTLVKKYRQRFFNQLICKNVFIEFEKKIQYLKIRESWIKHSEDTTDADLV